MQRLVTFIDVDDNRLELWLKPDRVQLVVIDSRPELEAAELRRFASVVFAEYVARDLADRLDAARAGLQAARDRARGADQAQDGELAAALDGALRAIGDLAAAVAIPGPVQAVEAEVECDAETDAPGLDPEPAEPAEPAVRQVTAAPRAYPSVQALLRAALQPAGKPADGPTEPPTGRPAGKRRRRGRRAEEASSIRWGATEPAIAAAGAAAVAAASG